MPNDKMEIDIFTILMLLLMLLIVLIFISVQNTYQDSPSLCIAIPADMILHIRFHYSMEMGLCMFVCVV